MLRVRRNVNSLTAAEKSDLVQAIKALKANGKYDQYVREHDDIMKVATVLPGESADPHYRNGAHRGPAFGPWHREFLRRFELDLAAAVPGVTLPYWDWSVDQVLANPLGAPVWADDLMGGAGLTSDTNMVSTGPFRYDPNDPNTWRVVTGDGEPGPGLRRTRGALGKLPSRADVATVATVRPYDAFKWDGAIVNSFRNQLEGWRGPNLHNTVHVWVGGSMSPGTSPNDPVFFLHHCNVDRLWWEWQRRYPADGYQPVSGGPPGHNLHDRMLPWDAATTPASVLDIHKLGYTYDTDPPAALALILDRSTFGQDEILAAHPSATTPAVFNPAFWVTVDGCTPAELGLTTANLGNPPSIPAIALSPAAPPGMSVQFVGPVYAEDPALPPVPQRFRFQFKISFTSDAAFGFPGDSQLVGVGAQLSVSGSPMSAAGVFQLLKKANPFILDGPTWWLSVDLRVFKIRAGDMRFGVPMIGDAPAFIQSVITALNAGGGSAGGQSFGGLPDDLTGSTLELSPIDSGGAAVYNFALARVRMRGLTQDATNTRVFFRMMQAQSTSTTYDQNAGYRRFSDGVAGGRIVALPGVRGGEYVSFPCFATPRVDTASVSMTTQTDQPNVRTIVHDPSGAEVQAYYGCWLDINQPGQAVLPLTPPANADGPFAPGTMLPLQRAVVRSPHQCLVAEIAFDPDVMPSGVDPSTSDKLAQRNMAWVSIPNPGRNGSRRAPQPFEVRGTPAVSLGPDELMIDWGDLPAGSRAQIYLPTVSADTVLALAESRYSTVRLGRADDHTLVCPAETVTYLPLPPGDRDDHAGLITVELPLGVRRGQLFGVRVRQITPMQFRGGRGLESDPATRVGGSRSLRWQRVVGAFQLNIPVETKEVLLAREQRLLSLLRWIGAAIPPKSRWYPVFERYLDQIADRVDDLGGDAAVIEPTPTGAGHRPCLPPQSQGEKTTAGMTVVTIDTDPHQPPRPVTVTVGCPCLQPARGSLCGCADHHHSTDEGHE